MRNIVSKRKQHVAVGTNRIETADGVEEFIVIFIVFCSYDKR